MAEKRAVRGHAYRPRIPIDGCRNPQQPVVDALAAISWPSNETFAVVSAIAELVKISV